MINTLLLAFALAMDCFAISLSAGAALKKPKKKDVLLIALYFGGFQGLFAVFGWFLGFSLEKLINSFDHWIAFCLLVAIGLRMIYEAFQNEESSKFKMSHKILLILAVADSLDAFGVGVNIGLLKEEIFITSIIIALVSFVISIIGVYAGKTLQKVLGKKAEIVGGMILIGIGINILYEHIG